ncbi:MAG: hypothetical protein IPM27_11530 [Nitrosomonadales bacterium]|nr:hypothetical protein [Nitrosomonadales bacterium]
MEELYDGLGLIQKNVKVTDGEIAKIYRDLHDYAGSPDNFAPEVHAAINNMPGLFEQLACQIAGERSSSSATGPARTISTWAWAAAA